MKHSSALSTPPENATLEYKEARDTVPKSFFETVCAFLNRDGGDIVLGVADDGTLTGVNPVAAGQMLRDISNLSNNPQKIFPPYLLFPKLEIVGDKTLIRTHVPCSSQVHRVGDEVFLRGDDGDYRLKDPYQIAGLVNRKLSFYSEQRVLPWLGMADLSPSLFLRARELFHIHHRDHPWLRLDNEGILRTGGFIRKDLLSAETGYTLAAALMFGTDATIQEAAPGMSFDALLRRRNIARYDDRLLLHTNLIDTFDRLMGFVEKHLDDPFYMEGTSRVNLRDRIFRELVSNLIAHREYTSAAPASLTIFHDKVVFKNPHVPHVIGNSIRHILRPFQRTQSSAILCCK
jgi:ATP-dependent DNA helicase RecG